MIRMRKSSLRWLSITGAGISVLLLQMERGVLSAQSDADDGAAQMAEKSFQIETRIACRPSDFRFHVPIHCGTETKNVYEWPRLGLIISKVVADGRDVEPERLTLEDKLTDRINLRSPYWAYEINLRGLVCYEGIAGKELWELSGLLYHLPEKVKMVEIEYYSRETLKEPVYCKAIILVDEEGDDRKDW